MIDQSIPVEIRVSNFEEILPFWREQLWPGRKSAIEALSAIGPEGNIEMRLMSAKPYFFVAFSHLKIVGTVSGFMTSTDEIRVRGLWVDPDYRRRQIANRLLDEVLNLGRDLGASFIWTMARAESISFYERMYFQIYQTTHAFEFGPHHFAKRSCEFLDTKTRDHKGEQ